MKETLVFSVAGLLALIDTDLHLSQWWQQSGLSKVEFIAANREALNDYCRKNYTFVGDESK